MSHNTPQDRHRFEDENGNIHSFIVRVWREEADSDTDPFVWRGHITPVPGEQRFYFTDCSEIPGLLLAHLTDHA
ncbi:MAG: hypothetical protein JXB85_00225 [Anaerolineales bacterium]|nr:hypothetical protein [Anaerolineales bacterium]